MVTATIIDTADVEVQYPRSPTLAPRALRRAARAFRCLKGADVIWLAVRESRAQNVVIRCSHGARSTAGLGLRIEPGGDGVGGAVLQRGEAWRGELTDGGASALSTQETGLFLEEHLKHILVVPLRYTGAARRDSHGGPRVRRDPAKGRLDRQDHGGSASNRRAGGAGGSRRPANIRSHGAVGRAVVPTVDERRGRLIVSSTESHGRLRPMCAGYSEAASGSYSGWTRHPERFTRWRRTEKSFPVRSFPPSVVARFYRRAADARVVRSLSASLSSPLTTRPDA